jgi:hypothetical protein
MTENGPSSSAQENTSREAPGTQVLGVFSNHDWSARRGSNSLSYLLGATLRTDPGDERRNAVVDINDPEGHPELLLTSSCEAAGHPQSRATSPRGNESFVSNPRGSASQSSTDVSNRRALAEMSGTHVPTTRLSSEQTVRNVDEPNEYNSQEHINGKSGSEENVPSDLDVILAAAAFAKGRRRGLQHRQALGDTETQSPGPSQET